MALMAFYGKRLENFKLYMCHSLVVMKDILVRHDVIKASAVVLQAFVKDRCENIHG